MSCLQNGIKSQSVAASWKICLRFSYRREMDNNISLFHNILLPLLMFRNMAFIMTQHTILTHSHMQPHVHMHKVAITYFGVVFVYQITEIISNQLRCVIKSRFWKGLNSVLFFRLCDAAHSLWNTIMDATLKCQVSALIWVGLIEVCGRESPLNTVSKL